MSSTCYIVGAAPGNTCPGFAPRPGDLIIAADGGYARLASLGVSPDVIIGDFDSLGFLPDHPHVLPYPKEKDDTDMMLAIRHGLAKGCQSFVLYGGLGGAIEHTLANIQALTFLARHGARGTLIGEPGLDSGKGRDLAVHATVIAAGRIEFGTEERGAISVFALDQEARGVTLTGLQYPLANATLTNAFPLGVSNAFIGKKSAVSVAEGALLILWQRRGGGQCE